MRTQGSISEVQRLKRQSGSARSHNSKAGLSSSPLGHKQAINTRIFRAYVPTRAPGNRVSKKLTHFEAIFFMLRMRDSTSLIMPPNGDTCGPFSHRLPGVEPSRRNGASPTGARFVSKGLVFQHKTSRLILGPYRALKKIVKP